MALLICNLGATYKLIDSPRADLEEARFCHGIANADVQKREHSVHVGVQKQSTNRMR